MLVATLDQQPLRLLAPASALQREAAAQLLAVEHEHRMTALERLGPRHASALLVGAAVPDDDPAAARRALELVVCQGVILDLHREPSDSRVKRRPLGYGPRPHHAVH